MTTAPRYRRARPGFTLVELMVATALVVIILTILAVAFGAASDSLSRMRSVGNMATQLRTAQDRLRADLEAPHFDVRGTSPAGLRLSDLRYDLLGTPGAVIAPPPAGYFRIEQGSGSLFEGPFQDDTTAACTRATPWPTDTAPLSGHALEFTTQRQGRGPDDLFVVPVGNAGLVALNAADTPLSGGQFVTRWARVRWFLANPQTAGGVPVWTLYRRVQLVAPQGGVAVAGNDLEVVAHTPANLTLTLDQLANPANRTPMNAPHLGGTAFHGDDIVLSNVTSFEVKAVWDAPAAGGPRGPRSQFPATPTPAPLPTPIGPGVGAVLTNADFPYDDLPAVTENPSLNGRRVFDTWAPLQTSTTSWNVPNSNDSLPLRVRVTALQVKIRMYDPKTLLSRQVSFVVPQ